MFGRSKREGPEEDHWRIINDALNSIAASKLGTTLHVLRMNVYRAFGEAIPDIPPKDSWEFSGSLPWRGEESRLIHCHGMFHDESYEGEIGAAHFGFHGGGKHVFKADLFLECRFFDGSLEIRRSMYRMMTDTVLSNNGEPLPLLLRLEDFDADVALRELQANGYTRDYRIKSVQLWSTLTIQPDDTTEGERLNEQSGGRRPLLVRALSKLLRRPA